MAKAVVPQNEELTIFPRWKKRKAVASRIDGRASPERFMHVLAYNNREPDGGYPNETKNVPRTGGYLITGYELNARAVASALFGRPWLSAMSESLAYLDLELKIDFYWHWRFRVMRLNKRSLRLLSPITMIELMGWHFVLGQLEEAKYSGCLAWATLHRSYYLELEYSEYHRRAQAFMHRLFCRWAGVPEIAWPAWAYQVECYEELLNRWNAYEPNDIAGLVERACNRHTHEARPETTRSKFDFGMMPLMHSPIEILTLYRIRQSIGLENPSIDHPLLTDPFRNLCDPEPVFPPNDMMQATLERLRTDWPDFDDITSTDALLRIPETG